MKDIEKKCLQFVLRYYKLGALDTQKAIRNFELKNGLVQRNSRIYWYTGIAATILLFIVSGIYFYNIDTKEDWTKLVAANSTETYLLPDSTAVTLSPHSSLSYQPSGFAHKNRQVAMSGKIYFSVKRNEKLPFEIVGSISRVRVLGTRFQVIENHENSQVCVVSGKVLFTAKGQDKGIILTKGMEATLADGEQMPVLSTTPNINQTAWATGVFTFDDTPLPIVLKELSDYYHVQLTSKDIDKKLSGEFTTGSIDEIVDLIENVLQVTIQKN
ncbi:FecR family protein [Bacteroides neonati]|uniref:FecR family protein n=1 Tax=Bacteroides neonati TaxID=1347393 RepID=UPI0004AD273D|nr:FecR domain-containing protein [Bacteroides neonati]